MVNQRRAVAIIPARGGSKRISRKSIIDFSGRPMIAWTIVAALESNCFDRIIVSTDDDDIAAISRQWGAEVPFLRASHADDHSPVSSATIATLEQIEDVLGETYSVVAQLMANCPLRDAGVISDAMDAFATRDADFQISAVPFGWRNPWWALRLNPDDTGTMIFKNAVSQRSQDLGNLYCPTGAIWIAKTRQLREAGTFYGPAHRFHVLNWKHAVDIDDEEDLEMARAVSLMLKSTAH